MIEDKKLTLAPTSNWDDPWENFFYKLDFRLVDDTPVKADNLIPGIFGQSWTLTPESDAMWRIYSHLDSGCSDDIGICVRTTARKIFDAVYTCDADMANAYIGKVLYMDESEVEQWVKDNEPISDINRVSVESLLIKRTAFKHEDEVRVLFIAASQGQPQYFGQQILRFDIHPDEFVDEIKLDPRIDAAMQSCIRDRLVRCGIDGQKIIKSTLYDMPHMKAVLG